MKMSSSSSATDCQKPRNKSKKNKSLFYLSFVILFGSLSQRRYCFRHGRESLGREIPFDTPLFIVLYYNPQDTKILKWCGVDFLAQQLVYSSTSAVTPLLNRLWTSIPNPTYRKRCTPARYNANLARGTIVTRSKSEEKQKKLRKPDMARLDTPNVTAEAPITFYYIIQQLYLEEIPSQPFPSWLGNNTSFI